MASSSESNVENKSVEMKNEDDEFLPGFKSVTEFSQHALSGVMRAIKSSNDLPAHGDDFDYYSSFEGFRDLMDIEGKRILDMMQSIMKHQALKGSLTVNNHKNIEDKFDAIVDANDQLLERVGTLLDEASGIKKQETPLVIASLTPKQTPTNASWNKKKTPTSKNSNFRLLTARFVQRPQTKFKEKVDNRNVPFVPRLKTKPNALKSLTESLLIKDVCDLDVNDVDFEYKSFLNPYQFELENFKPTAQQLQLEEPQFPSSVEETQFTYVETEAKLKELCEHLKTQTEIAIDLEAHTYRSYQGLTCLMQISTRNEDWVVDTLALRSEMHLLNDVFTDPKIVKVLHGADSDVIWLQRDFGLYLVNMFDTGQASRLLGFPRHSLAYLLQYFCNVEADKQYQLADWRIRPLPNELLHYAREDTRYLLYIYDRLKKLLLERGNSNNNLIIAVIDRSKDICLKTYEKPTCTENDVQKVYLKSRKVLNSQQMAGLRGLFEWRDNVARLEDESTGYVLPNHMLLQIAEFLPRESQGILACCNPIPPLVRQYIAELHRIILDARDVTLLRVEATKNQIQPTKTQHPKYDSSMLHCNHDTSHPEIGDIVDRLSLSIDTSLVATKCHLFPEKNGLGDYSKATSIFEALSKCREGTLTAAQQKVENIMKSLNSPFEKYQKPRLAEEWIKEPKLKLEAKTPENTWNQQINDIKSKWGSYLDAVATRCPNDTLIVQESEKSDNTASVKDSLKSQMKPAPKRKIPPPPEDEKASCSTTNKTVKGLVKRSKILDVVKEKLKEFKAFDYGKADMKVFEETSDGKKKDRKGKGKSTKSFRGRGNSGKKSLTYSKFGASNNKSQWPKR
ncbi:exosome complex component 10-like [Tubulanus polymorphus]|uniref:exosome complex component 10-like n=1 Tax=Tubulanus polymorphus TaxID=672921 RepID=UPI003DA3A5D9